MAIQVQFKRGTQSQNNNFTGAAGEISVNTDTNSLRVHNGIATGGFELARADLSNTTGQAPYAASAGIATYSGRSGIATYSSTAGVSTYSTTAGVSTYSSSSGIATYAATSGVSTTLTSTSSVNTTGIITASKFVGDGSGLTNLPGLGSGSGTLKIADDGVIVGTAGTIDFGSNISVSFSSGIATVNVTSSLPSRTIVTGITTAIAPNGIGNTDISGFKVYNILKVGISTASWVRIYTDSVSRTNDVSRVINNDPISGSGVIAEFISVGATTIKTGPVPTGYNDDTPETNQIYVSVTNLSGISTTIQVSLTILKLEG